MLLYNYDVNLFPHQATTQILSLNSNMNTIVSTGIFLRTNSICLCLQFHFNPAQSVLVVEGEDLDSINTAMSKVSYINSRQFPTPGLRRLHITTSVQ